MGALRNLRMIVSYCADCEREILPSDDFEFVPELGFTVHATCCTDPQALLDRIVTRGRKPRRHVQRFEFEPLVVNPIVKMLLVP